MSGVERAGGGVGTARMGRGAKAPRPMVPTARILTGSLQLHPAARYVKTLCSATVGSYEQHGVVTVR